MPVRKRGSVMQDTRRLRCGMADLQGWLVVHDGSMLPNSRFQTTNVQCNPFAGPHGLHGAAVGSPGRHRGAAVGHPTRANDHPTHHKHAS